MSMAAKHSGGRPRIDRQQGFIKALYRVLPHVYAGTVSQRQAALEIGISARSLKRYMEQNEQESCEGVSGDCDRQPQFKHDLTPSRNRSRSRRDKTGCPSNNHLNISKALRLNQCRPPVVSSGAL